MPPSTAPHHHHAVQFYTDDQSLLRTVGGFLAEGFGLAEPALVIATPAHREAIVHALESRSIDVAEARRLGDLVLLDADEMLSTFMINDVPDTVLFKEQIRGQLLQMIRGRERVSIRAYGEMVDVLWKQGLPDSAIRLEVLWNDLATTHAFSLLCGYAMGNFYKEAGRFAEVCRHHTHVVCDNVTA